jgi:hypothetical protein
MSDVGRRWLATALTLGIVAGVWGYIEWKSRPPAPPPVKAFPWEKDAGSPAK